MRVVALKIIAVFLLLVASAHAATIRGTVLSPDGKPQAGALVIAAEAAKFEPVTTDGDGHFEIQNAPDGALLLAAHERDFAQGKAAGGAVELRLVAPRAMVPAMRQQYFEVFNRTLDGVQFVEYRWAALGSDKMLALALQRDGALAPGDSDLAHAAWNRAGAAALRVLEKSLLEEPSWLRRNGAELLKKIPYAGAARFGAEAAVAVLNALGDEAQRAVAKGWLDAAAARKDLTNAPLENASRWFRLAGVAGALGDARAENFTLTALTYAEQARPEALREWDDQWGAMLAPGGPKLFDLVEGEWPPRAAFNALGGAVRLLASLDSELHSERARALLPQVKRLEAGGFNQASSAPLREKFSGSFGIEYWIRMMETRRDPAPAWAAYERSGEASVYLPTLTARVALQRGDKELARRALSSLARPGDGGSQMAAPAVVAESLDKELAAKLWQKAEARALEVVAECRKSPAEVGCGDIADYAACLSFFNPARARLLIEYMWPHPGEGIKQPAGALYNARIELAGAVFNLDPLRALEMLQEGENAYQDKVRARIAAYLLADENQRLPVAADGD